MFILRFSVLALVLACMSSVAMAQERTAGSSLDTQMSWTALTSQIKAADNKAVGANSRIDQIALCGSNGKVYAPGAPGADGQGCKDTTVPSSITNSLTTVNGNITNLQNSLNQLIVNMQGCSKAGQIFNGKDCAKPKLTFKTISLPLCGPAPKGGSAKCQNNDPTAERVCQLNKMSGVSSYAVGSENNPGPNTNNFNATWNGSAFVPVSAYNYKYFMSSVSCYNFTFE